MWFCLHVSQIHITPTFSKLTLDILMQVIKEIGVYEAVWLSTTIKMSQWFYIRIWVWSVKWASQVAQVVKNLPAHAGDANRKHRCDPWVGNIPWNRKWQPTPVFLLAKSHGQRSLAGCGPLGCRVRHDWSDLACTHTFLNIFTFKLNFQTACY